jgi:hypothetical protein
MTVSFFVVSNLRVCARKQGCGWQHLVDSGTQDIAMAALRLAGTRGGLATGDHAQGPDAWASGRASALADRRIAPCIRATHRREREVAAGRERGRMGLPELRRRCSARGCRDAVWGRATEGRGATQEGVGSRSANRGEESRPRLGSRPRTEQRCH